MSKLQRGDIVFFQNKKPIDWERNVSLANIQSNRVYTINSISNVYPDNIAREAVSVFDSNNYYHEDHFYKIEGNEVQGITIFRANEYAECICTEPVD